MSDNDLDRGRAAIAAQLRDGRSALRRSLKNDPAALQAMLKDYGVDLDAKPKANTPRVQRKKDQTGPARVRRTGAHPRS